MNKMFKRVLSMVLTASMVVLPFVQTVGEFTFFADEANDIEDKVHFQTLFRLVTLQKHIPCRNPRKLL